MADHGLDGFRCGGEIYTSGRQSILSRAMAAAAFLAVITFGTGEPAAAILDDLRQRGTMRIAYRDDAIPISLKNAVGKLTESIVNLCRAVVAKTEAGLSMTEIKITYVPVAAANRFDAIEKGQRARIFRAVTNAPTRTILDGRRATS